MYISKLKKRKVFNRNISGERRSLTCDFEEAFVCGYESRGLNLRLQQQLVNKPDGSKGNVYFKIHIAPCIYSLYPTCCVFSMLCFDSWSDAVDR